MKSINEIAFLIQGRLGSQRCTRKMIRPFANSTLFEINIKKLVDSKLIPNQNIYISVYEPELIEIAQKYPVNIFRRSEKSAKSEGTPMTEIYEWWNKIPFKYVVMTNACCPFLRIETIDEFLINYLESDRSGMFGVIEKKNYFWDKEGNFLTPVSEEVMNTKTAQPVYEAAHCLYAGSLADIGIGIWMGDFKKRGDIVLHPVPEDETFDIDYEWQFVLYEKLYNAMTGLCL